MKTDEVELLKLRTNFYHLNYRRMVNVLLAMLLISFILIGVIFYQIISRTEAGYFASSQSGTLTQIYPLSDPILPSQEVIKWATDIAKTAYTYNFINYNEVAQKTQKYFTPEGWTNFKNITQDPKTLEAIVTQKIVVTSTIREAPVILQQGVVKGRYVWHVQIPLRVTYQSPTETTHQAINLLMLITRVSTFDIAIADFTVTASQ